MLLSNNVTQGNININIIKPQNTNRLGKVLTNACFSEYFLSTLPQIGWDIHGCFIFFFFWHLDGRTLNACVLSGVLKHAKNGCHSYRRQIFSSCIC